MTAAGIVLVLGFGGLVVQLWRLADRWRVGRSAPIAWGSRMAKVPRLYLRDVHRVVARDRLAARMHALTAGGLTLALAAAICGQIGHLGGRGLAALQLAGAALALTGIALALGRRGLLAAGRRAHFSGGAFRRLAIPLALFALFLAAAAWPEFHLGRPAWWVRAVAIPALGLVALFWLLRSLRSGPMKHAAAGVANLIVHPRPARFAKAEPDGALAPLDLATIPLGIERLTEFPWNRLVNLDACVQCGRCEAACPAYAAGQPLNPKALIVQLGLALEPAGTRSSYAGNPHPHRAHGGVSVGPRGALVGPTRDSARIEPDTLWACTTCRACVEECPMMIEHLDAIIDLRRFQTLENGALPIASARLLEELRATDNLSGRRSEERTHFASDLDLPLIADRGHCDVLLWLGEGAFHLRNQRTLRALVELLRRARIDFAVLGTEECDTGDLARRLGDEALFQSLARRNIETLERYRFDRIVTVDPHVLHSLKNEYPALGGHYAVVHHASLIAQLLSEGRLGSVRPARGRVTYHDPCYLGRYNGEFAAPRALIDALGLERVEMVRSGRTSMCCGGGGGAPISDVPGDRRIPDLRMDQARATGADTLAVACPTCAQMLEGVIGPRPAVVDIAELVLASVGGSG